MRGGTFIYKHYVVVLEWSTEDEEGVQILGVEHTFDEAKKIFDEYLVKEREFVEEHGYEIDEDTSCVFCAGIMGYWKDNHTTLYIQGVM